MAGRFPTTVEDQCGGDRDVARVDVDLLAGEQAGEDLVVADVGRLAVGDAVDLGERVFLGTADRIEQLVHAGTVHFVCFVEERRRQSRRCRRERVRLGVLDRSFGDRGPLRRVVEELTEQGAELDRLDRRVDLDDRAVGELAARPEVRDDGGYARREQLGDLARRRPVGVGRELYCDRRLVGGGQQRRR